MVHTLVLVVSSIENVKNVEFEQDRAALKKLVSLLGKIRRSTISHPAVINHKSNKKKLEIFLPPKIKFGYVYITLERAFELKEIIEQVNFFSDLIKIDRLVSKF